MRQRFRHSSQSGQTFRFGLYSQDLIIHPPHVRISPNELNHSLIVREEEKMGDGTGTTKFVND
jgi:hypothetical protein